MGIAGAPPWAVSAPDLDVGAWARVQTTVNQPALSRPLAALPSKNGSVYGRG